MTDSIAKKVPLSIRFEPTLFDQLEQKLGSIPREKRPTKDAFVQDAVRSALTTTVTVTPGSKNITIKDSAVSSAEQTAAPAQPDILAGLKPDDAQAVREFVEILRGEDEWLRNMAMMAIESSRRLKAPQAQERVVADAPAARKAKSRG